MSNAFGPPFILTSDGFVMIAEDGSSLVHFLVWTMTKTKAAYRIG